MSNITFSHALFYQKSLIFTFFTIMLLSGIGNFSKDFLYYFRNSFDQGYHLMETLRRMTIFVIGTLGVLNLVLMEGDY